MGKNLTFLGSKGPLMQTEMRGDVLHTSFKYIQVALVRAMENVLLVPVVSAEGIQEPSSDIIRPPFLTSLAALMIYFDQNPVSLTQQREVFKQDREKLDTFFKIFGMNKIPFFHFIWIFCSITILLKILVMDYNYPMLYLVSGLSMI